MEIFIIILLVVIVFVLFYLLFRKNSKQIPVSTKKAQVTNGISTSLDQSNKSATVTNSPYTNIDQSNKHYHLDLVKPKVKTLREWRQEEKSFNDPFFANQRLNVLIEQIRQTLLDENSTKTRVLGLSGLGKTRFIYECFSGFDAFKNEVYYCDVSSQIDNVVFYIKKLIREKGKGCFILDNCKSGLNNLLLDDIEEAAGPIHLITIDKEVGERFSADKSILLLELTPEDYEGDIIRNIIAYYYPNLPPPDIEKIAAFSQGFPLIAKQLAYARDLGSENIGELSDDDLLRKLIGVEEKEDEDAYHVLRACSIFEKLGYSLDLKIHKEFVARTSAISRLTSQNKIELFENKCSIFLNRGILEKQGRFISVRPKPLAIRLAADWWRECIERGDAFEIIQQITKQGLGELLCVQIAKLDFLPEAQKLTEDLCGYHAPFGKAEVLNTSEGSRLFCYFAEVNPQVATDTLYYHYGEANIEKLIKVVSGRRYLVWTLEKLCFRMDTFENAIKILLNFAIAENENISNNATGQFLQLYQIFLPGTSVNLDERYKVLEYAFTKENPAYSQLALSAINRSLSFKASRMMGAENFGSSPKLIDFEPTKVEVEFYYEKIIQILKDQICDNKKHKNESKEILGKSIYNIFINGFSHIAIKYIEEILDCQIEFWEEALISIIQLYDHSKSKYPKEMSTKILELVKRLQPSDFADQYRMLVKVPIAWSYSLNKSYRDISKDGLSYSDMVKDNIINFIENNIEHIDVWNLEILFENQQQQSVFFGKELGNALLKRNKSLYETFLENLVGFTLSGKEKIKDVSVLAGYLSNTKDITLQNHVLDKIAQNDLPLHHLLNIARFCQPTIKQLKNWVDIYFEKKVDLLPFQFLAYGKMLNYLSLLDILNLCEKIADKGIENIGTALDILTSYVEVGEKSWEESKDLIKNLISTKGFMSNIDHYGVNITSYLREYILAFFQENDINFIQSIKNEVIQHISDRNRLGFHSEIENLLKLLINDYFSIIWKDLGQLILNDPYFYITAKLRFGVQEGVSYSDGMFFSNKENLPLLFEWCKNNTPKAPILIAGIMPTRIKNEDGKLNWHPFALDIINNFGDDEELLNQLRANFGSFGIVSSSVPYMKSKLSLLEQIKNHSINRVKNWANDYISDLTLSIERETLKDEELGIV